MMQREQILALLAQRGKGAAKHLDVLKEEVEKRPYFTAIRLLYLKALQEAEQLGFEHELKRCAAHVPRRERLFEWVSRPLARAEEVVIQTQEATVIQSPTAEPAVRPLTEKTAQHGEKAVASSPSTYERPEVPVYVNDAAAAARRRVQEILEQSRLRRAGSAPAETGERAATPSTQTKASLPEPPALKPTLPSAPSPAEQLATPHNEAAALSPAAAATQTPTELPLASAEEPNIQPIDAPQKQKAEETPRLRFSEWLQQLQAAPIAPTNNKQEELVERFLKDPPSFRPRKELSDQRNIAQESLKENPEIMTETLARLYTEQGHYQKAIQAYEIMSLRFPEKSSFFAGRIRELRKRLKEKK